jgi:fermentation-respiration switch protein FrsA (DUF1100 family)
VRVVITTIAALVLIVALLAVLVRRFEPAFAFFPTSGESATPATFGAAFARETLTTSDGERLGAWALTRKDAAATVLYFHGNGGNLSMWAPIITGIHARGYDVYAFDYRGYGVSSGRPTERGLYRDVEAAVEWVGRGHQRRPIVYWGRSLGATMAAYAASVRRPDGIILESGFRDARSLMSGSPVTWLLFLFATYRFPTAEWLRGVDRPVLVVHGDRDRIVPFQNGQRLFEAIEGEKRLFVVAGGDHNDTAPPDPVAYWRTIDAFITGL